MEILTNEVLMVSAPLLVGLIVLFYLYFKKVATYNKFYEKYKDLIDIDIEVEKKQKDYSDLKTKFNSLNEEYTLKKNDLNSEYQGKRKKYEELLKEISILEEDLEFIEYGIYKPHYDFDTSESYKSELDETRKLQKQVVKNKAAVACYTEWVVEGSKKKGQKMMTQYTKLMLRAFNGECDAAVLKVKWNNITKMEDRVHKAFEKINDLGSVNQMEIAPRYLKLKLSELQLAYEYQEKLYEEKEEQRRIREQMREEEKVRRDIEKAQKEAEGDEKRYEKALSQATIELEKVKGEELEKLLAEITTLNEKIKVAEEKKERALSRAQMTKSGHVYIISNLGSFGESVYKIGMTRRLDPLDRVKELGDASVPFSFDVHAMIYSEDAPKLESKLHQSFKNHRVNLVNYRKEYFRVALDEIESLVHQENGTIEFMKIAEAKEFHETVALLNQKAQHSSVEDMVEAKFPSSL